MSDFNADKNTLTRLLGSAKNRLLDVVDAQGDFMWKRGALGIHPDNGSCEDASAVIMPMNRFFADLSKNAVDAVIVKFDTHFTGEYAKSPERDLFPEIHCEFGTPGWSLAVTIAPLTWEFPTYIMAKNVFDMWGSNPTGVAHHDISFASDREEHAYSNLFKLIRLQAGECPATKIATATDGMPRDRFFCSDMTGTAVVLCGVASDFCDDQAIAGYLQRGATVVVAEDLVAGIGGLGSPVPATGAMRDVVAARLAANPDFAGRLYVAQSADILDCLNSLAVTPGKPQPHSTRLFELTR